MGVDKYSIIGYTVITVRITRAVFVKNINKKECSLRSIDGGAHSCVYELAGNGIEENEEVFLASSLPCGVWG